MAFRDPAESFADLRYANSGRPDINSDELSGSIRITFDKTTLLCDPCLEDWQNLPAEGYCVDCCHYLCEECFKCHRRPVPCRHHQLLDKQRMPKTKPAPVYKDECTDKCEEHGDEIIKFYCEECRQFGCTVCVATKHNKDKCKVGYIPKLSKDFLQSKEYTSFKASLNSLANKAATVLSEASSNVEAVNSQADQALTEVRTLRKEIDSYFDEIEKEIVEKVEKARTASQKELGKISKQCEALSRDIGELQLDVTEKENKGQKCRLFVDTKQALDTLEQYDDKMRELESENKVGRIEFIPSYLLSHLIQDKALRIGQFVQLDKLVAINSSNESNCNITGISILPNNKVALADNKNRMIKIVDTNSNTIVSSFSWDLNFLWGITRVSDSEVAVMKGSDMEIYSFTNEIKLNKTVRWSGVDNWTLLYTNNRFIVVTDTEPPTLRIVDMNGEVVKTFPTEIDGKALFDKPWYMAVNPDHTRIYVSDWGMETVTYLTFDGEVRARYKIENGWSPRGVAVSRDGTVYVVGSYDTICILSCDLQEICVINGRKYGIHWPQALAYCDRDHKLFVGMGSNEVVVFNV